MKLCTFFEIDTANSANYGGSKSEIEALLTKTLTDVWDGTSAHADLLIKLVKSTKTFSVRRHSKQPPV